jgi:trigger factor
MIRIVTGRHVHLKITTEPLENRQLLLTIEVDEEQTQRAMQRAARQIARQVNIPGFRKGKAPYDVIIQRYGEETIRKEAVDLLTEEVYREALEQEEIKPYAPGVLDDVTLDPITFRLTIPLQPTVDLGDYHSYRLKHPTVRVYKKEVQEVLEEMREQNAILELVDRPVALDDGVAIDILGRSEDGKEFLKGDDVRLLLDAESTSPAPGFAEAIVGMSAGEERTFTLTLPDDFSQSELQGQEATFTVKMAGVYESTLPELDDDLARTIGNFGSLKELEEQVKEQLRVAAQGKADEEYTQQVLEAIIEQAQVEYPPVMLKETLDEVVEDVEQVVKRDARLSIEDYLRIQNKTMEELRQDLEPRAASRLKSALVLGEVVRLEGLKVDEGEINVQIEQVSASWGVRADEVRTSLSSEGGRRAMGDRLLTNKAVQRLVAIAKGEMTEVAVAEAHEAEAHEAETHEASEDPEA